jgi:hypothetical protein
MSRSRRATNIVTSLALPYLRRSPSHATIRSIIKTDAALSCARIAPSINIAAETAALSAAKRRYMRNSYGTRIIGLGSVVAVALKEDPPGQWRFGIYQPKSHLSAAENAAIRAMLVRRGWDLEDIPPQD